MKLVFVVTETLRVRSDKSLALKQHEACIHGGTEKCGTVYDGMNIFRQFD